MLSSTESDNVFENIFQHCFQSLKQYFFNNFYRYPFFHLNYEIVIQKSKKLK